MVIHSDCSWCDHRGECRYREFFTDAQNDFKRKMEAETEGATEDEEAKSFAKDIYLGCGRFSFKMGCRPGYPDPTMESLREGIRDSKIKESISKEYVEPFLDRLSDTMYPHTMQEEKEMDPKPLPCPIMDDHPSRKEPIFNPVPQRMANVPEVSPVASQWLAEHADQFSRVNCCTPEELQQRLTECCCMSDGSDLKLPDEAIQKVFEENHKSFVSHHIIGNDYQNYPK